MQILQNVARRYGLVCLLHEKPFAGVNGSGKHNNWSMGTDTGVNLLEPGETPHENLAVPVLLRGRHPGRRQPPGSCCARRSPTPGQDHRLGANEAPPAIISIFLGAELEKIFDAIETRLGRRRRRRRAYLDLGASVLPRAADARRRPQPHLAVRLHGQQVRVPRARLEHVAGAPEHGAQHDRRRVDRRPRRQAREGAERRRLARGGDPARRSRTAGPTTSGSSSTATTTPRSGTPRPSRAAWPTCARRRTRCRGSSSPATVEVFEKYEVLSERELESRYEVFLEQYTTTINIEGETAAAIARTMLLPAAIKWLAQLGDGRRRRGVDAPERGARRPRRRVRRGDLRARGRQPRHPDSEDVARGAPSTSRAR